MSARRCHDCNHFWPDTTKFTSCPLCSTTTQYLSAGSAMSIKEADLVVAREEFEDYYEKHERKRRGPTPDVLGVEAAHSSEEWRQVQELNLTVAQIRGLPEIQDTARVPAVPLI